MSKELLYVGEGNTLGFGDFTLDKKKKVEEFEFSGDLYKVKTFQEITKLEKNGMFIYESVPGTTVSSFRLGDEGMKFQAMGSKDVQITVELEPTQDYKVLVDEVDAGIMTTNISGKLNISIDLEEGTPVNVVMERV